MKTLINRRLRGASTKDLLNYLVVLRLERRQAIPPRWTLQDVIDVKRSALRAQADSLLGGDEDLMPTRVHIQSVGVKGPCDGGCGDGIISDHGQMVGTGGS
jgi:hypothetical protein